MAGIDEPSAELRARATATAIAVATADTARKNSAGRIQARAPSLEELMTPAGAASTATLATGVVAEVLPRPRREAQRWITTSRSSVISRTAYAGPSFVLPEPFTPPYGIWSERKVGASLTVTPPNSRLSAQRSAVSIDAVKTPAWRPNGVPFARSIASSIESNGVDDHDRAEHLLAAHLRVSGTLGEHRRPDQPVRLAAREQRRAGRLRLLDPRRGSARGRPRRSRGRRRCRRRQGRRPSAPRRPARAVRRSRRARLARRRSAARRCSSGRRTRTRCPRASPPPSRRRRPRRRSPASSCRARA